MKIADFKKRSVEHLPAYEDLNNVTQKLGEERLNIAVTGFAESLKQEDAAIQKLKAGLDAYLYLTTLQNVYTARIELMKAKIDSLKQEEKYYIDRLAGEQKHYDTLSGLHAKATDAMKKQSEELKTLEDSVAKQRSNHAAQMLSLQKNW